jgi:N-acetylglucosamine malate deacetylase 1
MKKNILIVAAHPDDELLGCGGTILKHVKSGDSVFVCIVTVSDDRWPENYKKEKIKEAKLVDAELSIRKRFYCNLPTTSLNVLPTCEINSKLYEVFNEVDPDIVYTHYSEDINEDHRVIFNSVLVCTRPIKKLISLRCFETVSSTEWGRQRFAPNFYVCLSENEILKKLKAFSFYKSEVKKYPHPRSLEGLKNLAKIRGNEICKNYAESFIIINNYWE